jgi:hypothetical protein
MRESGRVTSECPEQYQTIQADKKDGQNEALREDQAPIFSRHLCLSTPTHDQELTGDTRNQ